VKTARRLCKFVAFPQRMGQRMTQITRMHTIHPSDSRDPLATLPTLSPLIAARPSCVSSGGDDMEMHPFSISFPSLSS
jgi:hypothetical protein